MKKINRRQFIQGSGVITLSGLGGLQLGMARNLLGTNDGPARDLLVYVFLNGAMDGLHMVPPRSGNDYNYYRNDLRPNLHIANTESLALNGQNAFGMHPAAVEMAGLFNRNKMAIVHATGLSQSNRSHFEATKYMELGAQDLGATAGTGWLTRYFQSSLHTPENALIPSVIPGDANSAAFLGDPTALAVNDPEDFTMSKGHWAWGASQAETLDRLYQNPDSPEATVGHQALYTSQVIQSIDWDNYQAGNNAVYPDSQLGDQLKTVAQLYRSDVGLEVAYVPTGGWDTHDGQSYRFNNLAAELSAGLSAFYEDLHAHHPARFTIVVQSEFGRRAYQNSANSTDHGYGNPMFIIGDTVHPGFHGQFPGLAPNELFEGGDVNVTTDYRDVISEILMKRMRNRFLGYIFPDYNNYNPLNIVQGDDMTPIFDANYDPIFASGFD